eukprot:PLAT2947.1.p1 GENE.PLAT2947.1~~PLAT2947.1.p1  ORF type:complete len:406 (+),score=189.30 PLAT2947.1:69-1286(+)
MAATSPPACGGCGRKRLEHARCAACMARAVSEGVAKRARMAQKLARQRLLLERSLQARAVQQERALRRHRARQRIEALRKRLQAARQRSAASRADVEALRAACRARRRRLARLRTAGVALQADMQRMHKPVVLALRWAREDAWQRLASERRAALEALADFLPLYRLVEAHQPSTLSALAGFEVIREDWKHQNDLALGMAQLARFVARAAALLNVHLPWPLRFAADAPVLMPRVPRRAPVDEGGVDGEYKEAGGEEGGAAEDGVGDEGSGDGDGELVAVGDGRPADGSSGSSVMGVMWRHGWPLQPSDSVRFDCAVQLLDANVRSLCVTQGASRAALKAECFLANLHTLLKSPLLGRSCLHELPATAEDELLDGELWSMVDAPLPPPPSSDAADISHWERLVKRWV